MHPDDYPELALKEPEPKSRDWETILLTTIPLGLLGIMTALGMVDLSMTHKETVSDIISITNSINFDFK